MSNLTAKGIIKTYGKKDVLHNIDLNLESGKIYGLIGRNGAGKTTLLSILTAQNPASSGSVTLDGKPVWENQDVLNHICFSRELGQMNGNNANTMKVKEYLWIAETFFPYWDKEMAKHLIEEFGLEMKEKISKLSKGMRSMVTIIVALASKAEFTFLDEPVAGLDVVAREKFYSILLDEFAQTGRTFVISTHIIEEAADLFEEVIIVDKGKILLKENTQELLERCWHISGHEEEVEKAAEGFEVHHKERMGRSEGVTILLKPGQSIRPIQEQYAVSLQKLSLQKVFVALCGEES